MAHSDSRAFCTSVSPQRCWRHFGTDGIPRWRQDSSGLMAWGFTFHRRGWPQPLTWYSVGTGILALILLLIMSWSRNPLNAPGLFEHLATGVLSLWLLVFAAGLTRHPEQALRR